MAEDLVSSRPWVQRRQWHPTPVLLPGKSQGWRSLVGCSPWGHEELDTTEWLHFHVSLSCIGEGNGNPLHCLAWRIPGTGEPGGLPSIGSHRVGHDWSDLAAAGLHEQWLLLLRISEVAAAVPQIITLRELQSWHVTRTPPASYLLDLTSKVTPYYSVTPIVRCYFCPKTYYCQA